MPFDQNGHMNPGGAFDAYWDLSGDLSTASNPDAASPSAYTSTVNLNVNLDGHVVLFGQDIDVIGAQASAQSVDGSSSSASGSYQLYLLGQAIPGMGGTLDATSGFNFGPSYTNEYDLPVPIQIWFFEITGGVTFKASINATGTLTPTGFDVSVTPGASLGVHIFGGVSVGFASGGVDVKMDLLDVSAPIKASAGFDADVDPLYCALTMKSSLIGSVTISAGGGEIDLEVSIGSCPFCVSDSFTLLSWGPIETYTATLFNVPLTPNFVIPLPTGVCAHPLSVSISNPTNTVFDNLHQQLNALVTSPDGNATCTWTGFANGDIQPNPQGCTALATFGNQGPRTLTVTATDTIIDQFKRRIVETGSATVTFDVADLPPGVYIVQTNPNPATPCVGPAPSAGLPDTGPIPKGTDTSVGCTNMLQVFNNQNVNIVESSFPATIGIIGEVTASASNTTTTWTATDSSGNTVTLTNPPCLGAACFATGINANLNQVSVSWPVAKAGTYVITMTTTASGTCGVTKFQCHTVVGTASTTITVVSSQI